MHITGDDPIMIGTNYFVLIVSFIFMHLLIMVAVLIAVFKNRN